MLRRGGEGEGDAQQINNSGTPSSFLVSSLFLFLKFFFVPKYIPNTIYVSTTPAFVLLFKRFSRFVTMDGLDFSHQICT